MDASSLLPIILASIGAIIGLIGVFVNHRERYRLRLKNEELQIQLEAIAQDKEYLLKLQKQLQDQILILEGKDKDKGEIKNLKEIVEQLMNVWNAAVMDLRSTLDSSLIKQARNRRALLYLSGLEKKESLTEVQSKTKVDLIEQNEWVKVEISDIYEKIDLSRVIMGALEAVLTTLDKEGRDTPVYTEAIQVANNISKIEIESILLKKEELKEISDFSDNYYLREIAEDGYIVTKDSKKN